MDEKQRALKRLEATLRYMVSKKKATVQQARATLDEARGLTADGISGRKRSIIYRYLGGASARAAWILRVNSSA